MTDTTTEALADRHARAERALAMAIARDLLEEMADRVPMFAAWAGRIAEHELHRFAFRERPGPPLRSLPIPHVGRETRGALTLCMEAAEEAEARAAEALAGSEANHDTVAQHVRDFLHLTAAALGEGYEAAREADRLLGGLSDEALEALENQLYGTASEAVDRDDEAGLRLFGALADRATCELVRRGSEDVGRSDRMASTPLPELREEDRDRIVDLLVLVAGFFRLQEARPADEIADLLEDLTVFYAEPEAATN